MSICSLNFVHIADKYLKAVERFYKRLIFELLEISPVLSSNEMYINNFVSPYSFIFASRKKC